MGIFSAAAMGATNSGGDNGTLLTQRYSKFANCCYQRCHGGFFDLFYVWRFELSLCFGLAPRAGFEPATNRLTVGWLLFLPRAQSESARL